MKKIFVTLSGLFVLFMVHAQDNLEVILKTRYSFNVPLTDVDSITFDLGAENKMMIFEYGYSDAYEIKLNRIDTLKFNTDTLVLDEPMDSDFEYEISLLSDTVVPLQGMILEDGQSVYDFLMQTDPVWLNDAPYSRNSVIIDASYLDAMDQKKLLLSRLFDVGRFLVTRSNHATTRQPNGLAYVFGGKNFEKLTKPVGPKNPNSGTTCAPDPGCVNDTLVGLDCSGMVGVMANYAGVPVIRGGATQQADTTLWNKALTASKSTNYDKLRYVPYTAAQMPVAQLKSGDIIFKPAGVGIFSHVGMILSVPEAGQIPFLDEILMYQSNGNEKLCPSGTSLPCTQNTSNKRGPRLIKVPTGEFNGLFSTNYRVLRLDTIKEPCGNITSVFDIDGNEYSVVSIGNQCWTKQNLKTTRFQNGSPISLVADTALWNAIYNNGNNATGLPGWCYYNNDSTNNAIYGKLYNWYVADDSRNVCPAGWRVPDYNDWGVIMNHLGGSSVAGQAMKDTLLWQPSGTPGTNSSGFSGLPSGLRYSGSGSYDRLGTFGFWWSSSELSFDETQGWYVGLSSINIASTRSYDNKASGISIRCIKE